MITTNADMDDCKRLAQAVQRASGRVPDVLGHLPHRAGAC
jgi:hypothetical protein